MKKAKSSGVDIVVAWNERTGPNAVPGPPDPALIRELAAELARMAARYAMAEARAAREVAQKGEATSVKQLVAASNPQPTNPLGRRRKKLDRDATI